MITREQAVEAISNLARAREICTMQSDFRSSGSTKKAHRDEVIAAKKLFFLLIGL